MYLTLLRPAGSAVTAVALSPAGDRFVAALASGALEVRRMGDGALSSSWFVTEKPTAVAWDYEKAWIAVGTTSGSVLLIDPDDGSEVGRITTGSDPVTQLAAHLDGLLVCLAGGRVTSWMPAETRLLDELATNVAAGGIALRDDPSAPRDISYDNRIDPWSTLFVATADGRVRDAWKTILATLDFGPVDGSRPIATNTASVAAGVGNTIVLQDTWPSSRPPTPFVGHEAAISHLAWGSFLLLSGDVSGAVKVWVPTTGACTGTWWVQGPVRALLVRGELVLVAGSDGAVFRGRALSPDASIFVAGSGDARLSGNFRGRLRRALGAESGVGDQGLESQSGGTWRMRYAIDRACRTLACRGRDGFVEVIDVASWGVRELPLGNTHEVAPPAFSPDGTQLLVGVERPDEVLRIEVASGRVLGRVPGGYVSAWHPSGERFVTLDSAGRRISLWTTAPPRKKRRAAEPIWSCGVDERWGDVAVSSSGGLVLYGGRSVAVLEARDIDTGATAWTTPIARRPASEGPMLNPNTPSAWESSAYGVVCVRDDGAIELLDERTGNVVSTGPNLGPAAPLRLLAQGARVAVASFDQRIRFYSLPDLRLIREARLDATPLALAWSTDTRLFVATAADETLELEVGPTIEA